MDDKFILMGLDDERAGKIAEVLKNKTCKKIIDYLGEVKEASEKDISDACGIPMNTVGYNIQNLIKSGLVEKTNNFFWSVKGKKIKMYKLAKKHIIISPSKKLNLNSLKSLLPVILFAFVGLMIVASLVFIGNQNGINPDDSNEVLSDELLRFESGNELLKAFENAQNNNIYRVVPSGWADVAVMEQAKDSSANSGGSGDVDYSETNIQVEGVDEADIIKTDGEYIYVIAGEKLIIAKAYPSKDAEILSETKFDNFYASEIFIEKDRLLVFGTASYQDDNPAILEDSIAVGEYYPSYINTMSVKLYDVSDKENPDLIKEIDFEGSYLTSRKINSDVYFVVNTYPRYYEKNIVCEDIIPKYSEDNNEMMPIAGCTDIGYIQPIQAQSFITIASISIDDENKEIEKEVIVGSGENIYASLENLYIAQTSWPVYERGQLIEDNENWQKTTITKFNLDNGKIKFIGNGQVKGNILNQFSMDEYKDNFRIATTISGYSDNKDTSTNNMYVLDSGLNVVGELEGIAPGESIYSVRFMGQRAYMVTFRHIDPLFVIDLSDAKNPIILGKLKIPGYSDYLHPYDETHLIGIGKEVDASIDADKVHTEGAVYYTAIQGVKLAIFDVSDVSNPIEMHKEVIGDRGTESLATSEHKAFLFDKEKGLLVVPMTVAELKPGQDKSQQGEFTFQGAYVYDISLKNGFDLKGKVTHYENNDEFMKSGYYFRGESSIKRSLYIGDVLYTLSDKKIQLNSLKTFETLKSLVFS